MNVEWWKLLLAAIGAVVTTIVSYHQIRSAWRNPRLNLKTDIEILNLIDKSDDNYRKIKEYIDEMVQQIYSQKDESILVKHSGVLLRTAFFLLWSVCFSFLTFYLLRDTFTWWAVLTGYFAIAGIGSLIMVVQPPASARKSERVISDGMRQ